VRRESLTAKTSEPSPEGCRGCHEWRAVMQKASRHSQPPLSWEVFAIALTTRSRVKRMPYVHLEGGMYPSNFASSPPNPTIFICFYFMHQDFTLTQCQLVNYQNLLKSASCFSRIATHPGWQSDTRKKGEVRSSKGCDSLPPHPDCPALLVTVHR
jgi:hypothetical protein